MSHELRTPMNGILGMTELALRAALDPTVRDYLDTAHESAHTLLELLNDILDFSRIEAGRLELGQGAFSLRSTLEQMFKTLAPRAYEKGVELIWDVPSQVPDRLVGDALRLRQVLTNLIGNATKFTHHGEIVVRVEDVGSQIADCRLPEGIGSETSNPKSEICNLKFSVSDTGIGMSPQEQQRIFTPFVQADATTTRRYGGTGLGLSITKSLVEMMGGRLWVESQAGQGSTFHFTVRLMLESGAECPPDADRVPPEQLRGVSVLVVDDNATNRRILEATLLGWGMRPELAKSAPAALAKLHEAASAGAPYPLFLIDAMLPETDGFTLVEWIRENPKFTGAAILMLSPVDHQVVHDRAAQLDIAAYLEKPVTQRELLRVIANALGIGARDGASTPLSHDPILPEKAARSLRILLAEDNPANQKVALHFLGQRGHAVEIAENGIEAIEMVGQKDFDVVLMDVQMSEMDGFQATSAIRALPESRKARLPIVAMTAHALKGDRERCLAAGMDDYLSKPIDAEELIAMVERLANQAAGSRPDQAPQPADAASPTDVARSVGPSGVFSLEEALSRCGEYRVFEKMVEYFFDEADPLLGRMRTALRSGNAVEMGNAAHRLKGTACYLGAPDTIQASQRVEQAGMFGNLPGADGMIEQLGQELDRLKTTLARYRSVQK